MRKLCCLYFFCVSSYANFIIPIRDPFFPAANQPLAHQHSVHTTTSLKTAWITLYFASAKNTASFLSQKNSGILSSDGQVHYDQRSNQLWVRDYPQYILRIQKIAHHLDQPGPQFLIKAKIVNIDRQYRQALGVLFHTQNKTASTSEPLTLSESDIDNDTNQFVMTIAKLAGNHLLNLQLSALEQEGHATLISSPALMTLNNQPAVIESGAEVPYQQSTSSGATSVSFKKAALCLKVTPIKISDHKILLRIALNQDKVSALTVNGVPAIQTQQITTQVIVRNQQTIVLGGILETTQARQVVGIPMVDHIPLMGQLFQHHMLQHKQEELLIFITPSMMTE